MNDSLTVAEAADRKSLKAFEASSAIISLDRQGTITAWNLPAQRMFGFTAEEAIGRPVVNLLCPPAARTTSIEWLNRVVSGEGTCSYFETQRQRKDGTLLEVAVTSIGVRRRNGELVSIWTAYRDISDQKRDKAELETQLDQEQAVAEFARRALAIEELPPLLEDAVALVTRTLQVDYCKVLELQPGGKALLLRAGVGWKPGIIGQATVGAGLDSQAGYTLLSRTPVIVEDLRTEARFHGPQLLFDHEVISGLSAIIGDYDHPYGVLGAHSRTRRKFTEHDAHFLEAIAGVIGGAARRLRAEQELRRSQEWFRSLIDNTFDVIVVVDEQGFISYENAAMHRVFGYEPGELLGRIAFDFVHPQDYDGARQATAEALRTGAATLHCRGRRKDGVWVDCELALSRLPGAEGSQPVVVTVRDISSRKQAEQGRAFLASIVESAQVAIIGTTPDGTICSWNHAAESLYGYSPAEILGRPFETLVPPGEQGCDDLLREAVAGEHRGLRDVRRRCKDGSIIPLSVSNSPIRDQGGAVLGLASFERSPNEETRLERELQQAHAYTRGLIESSLDAMLVVDSGLIITDVNEQTVNLTGSSRDAVIGSRFDSHFTDPERAAHGIKRTLREGALSNYDLTLKTAAGKEIAVSLNASAQHQGDGHPQSVFAVARDVTQQKQLERQLREAQAYTRGLIDSAVDAMVTVDGELVINDLNERMAALVETPKTMLIGNRFDRLFTNPERAAEAVERTLKQGSITNCDLSLRTLTGKEVTIAFNASVFYDAAGQPQGVFGVARDVTEQRDINDRLRQQQMYSRSLFESAIDALVAVNPRLVITDVNEQTVLLSGYPREELIGSSFPLLFVDPEQAGQAIQRALAEGAVKNCELAMRSTTGEELPVSLNAAPFKDAQDNVLGVLAAARDIGEQRHLERERSLLASIVTSSPDAIYSFGPDTIVSSWNTGAERLIGYHAAEMIGRSITICVPLERRGELFDRLGLVLLGKGVQRFESQRRRKDGHLVDVSETMSPITDAQGRVTAIANISRDITERKRFEARLTEARDQALEGTRVRAEFLANMSHEVRTPLNSIAGMADMLLDTALTDEQHRRVAGVKESVTSLLSVLNDILDFSKLSADKVDFQTVDFDLEEVLYGALEPFAELARSKGLEVIARIEPDAPQSLNGDPDRLRQVLANLFSNAVKFTESGEIVIMVGKISESPTNAMLRFEVRDTGIGIPAQAQTRLFSPFSQVEGTARRYGGTGLGLTIARHLVERMGGSVGVTSTLGAGSTFWFTARLQKQPGAGKQLPSAPVLEGARVLIVDDNPDARDFLKVQLLEWKMSPDIAAGPAEGLAMIRKQAQEGHPYALALLDMQMPEMNGVELARQIRQISMAADVRLVILSSAPENPDLSKLRNELDVHSLLLKPVKQSDLFAHLVEALGGKPLPGEQAARSREPAAAPAALLSPQGIPLRVLVAEDNAANREVAIWQLQKLGCLAETVVNGQEAVEAADEETYDVILMDCRMPTVDGYEATRRIRQREGRDKHTPIVAMTAHALTGDREKCLASGMDDYISKPVALETLAAALRRVLATPADTPAPPPEKTAENANASAADAATMAALRAEQDLLPGLIEAALGEMPEQLKQIEAALAAHNNADAAVLAHSLKGTAKIFGATQMAEAAAALEKMADDGAIDQAPAGLARLVAECERLIAELKRERAQLPAS